MIGAFVGCACMGMLMLSSRVNKPAKMGRRRASKMAGYSLDIADRIEVQDRYRRFNAVTRRRNREGIYCPALPWLPDAVDSVLAFGIGEGLRDEEALSLMILHEIYDETVHGDVIQWPTIPEDCAELKAIEERVHIRVRRVLAEIADHEADGIYQA